MGRIVDFLTGRVAPEADPTAASTALPSVVSVALVFATSASPPDTPLCVPFTDVSSFTAFHAESWLFAAFALPSSWVPQSMLTAVDAGGYATVRS